MDLPLFEGIISDLFPGRKRPVLDYGALNSVMKLVIQDKGLQPHPFFTTKVYIYTSYVCSNIGFTDVGSDHKKGCCAASRVDMLFLAFQQRRSRLNPTCSHRGRNNTTPWSGFASPPQTALLKTSCLALPTRSAALALSLFQVQKWCVRRQQHGLDPG